MKSKYLLLVVLLSFIQFSCSNQEDDCTIEKNEITEKFNMLIELSESDEDEAKKKSLIQQRDDKLKLLDC